jgi:hypothetical protein
MKKRYSCVLPSNDAFKLRVTSLVGIVSVFHQLFDFRNLVAEVKGPIL